MNNKLSTKILESADVSKLIADFDVSDYVVRDSSEVKTVVSLLLKEQDKLTAELEALNESSGSNAIVSKIDSIKSIIKTLLCNLSSRVEDAEVNDKTLVKLTKDDVVEVVDGNESRYETTEVTDSTLMFLTDVSYTVLSVEEHNELSGDNKTEEAYFYDLLCKFVSLSLDNTICFAKRYLRDFEASVASEIIEKNYEWHTLVSALSINKAKLNSNLKDNSQTRDELINLFYIKKENNVKTKVPTNAQMSLFDDFDYEEVNVLLEGDSADEDQQ